ncbi:MAG TPA: LysR family transcriptional regulator [Kofleriaceae bacterium]
MELRHLRSIVALAEELHFGRAALRLAVTQPALSQQITQLEAELDARLFERQPRVALTPVGAALLGHARRILDAVAEAEAEARSLANLTRRRIRLGYLEYWNPPFLAKAMRTLRELDPPVVLEPRNLYSAEVLAGLRDRSLEIGFVHLPVADDSLTVRPLLEGRWSLVVRRSHPLARRAALVLPDLAGEPLVFFDRTVNPPLHAWLLGRFAEAKVTPRIVYATTQPQVGVDLVREGVGAFFVASYVLRTLPRGLVMRPFADLPPMRIGAAWRGDQRTPALAALLDALPKFPPPAG